MWWMINTHYLDENMKSDGKNWIQQYLLWLELYLAEEEEVEMKKIGGRD